MNPAFKDMIDILFTKRHNAIYDPEYQKHLKKAPWEEWLSQNNYFDVVEEYISVFIDWIYSSRKNTVSQDLKEKYFRKDITVGTTQTFDEAYFRYAGRRLRLFRGEYAYHRRCYPNWLWLDQAAKQNHEWGTALDSKDWVIVSHPFCGTGGEHPKLKELLDQCEKKNVPVLMDCAWFGTCFGLNFDFSHPAIKAVAFSLSKGIGLGSMRTGLRFSSYQEENMPIAQQNRYKHLVLSNCQIGIYQMKRFNSDFIFNKYFHWYEKLCKSYGMKAVNCLHVSLLPSYNEYAGHFLVDESYSKVGVREALKAIRQKKLIL